MYRYPAICLSIALGLSVSAASYVQAETTVFNSIADSRVFDLWGNGDTNYGDTGNATVIPNDENALIKFDISSLSEGLDITSATLTLTRNVDVNCLDANLSVWRVANDWVESQVTWKSRSTGNAWANPGGDAVGTGGVQLTDAYDTVTVLNAGASIGDAVQMNVTDMVRQWYQGTHANYGMLITSIVPGVYPNEFYFATKEAGVTMPTLTVETSAVPEPSMLCLIIAGAIGLCCYAWRKRRS